jgi:hypothetical protein
MIIEHKSGDCITIVRCADCGSLIYGPFLLKSADVYNEQVRALFEAHMSQVHSA